MQIMHVSAQSTNLNFTVPVTSNIIQRQTQPVLECRSSQHSGQIIGTDTVASADCDTEDEVIIIDSIFFFRFFFLFVII